MYHFTECRAEGHSWKHQQRAINSGIATGVIGLVSDCTVCGMERTRWVTRSGKVVPPSYKAPEGYRTSGDSRRTAQEWRRTYVAHLFEESA